MNRWNPWTAPVGTPPDATARADSLGRGATAHLGAALVLVNVAAAISALGDDHRAGAGVILLVGAIVVAAAAEWLSRRDLPVLAALWGLVAAFACLYLAEGLGLVVAAGGASDATAGFAAGAALLASGAVLHARRASMGTIIAATAGLIVTPLALVGTDAGQPHQVYAAVLIAVSVVCAAGVVVAAVRPPSVLAVASVATGTGGAALLLSGHTPAIAQLSVVVLLLALCWLCLDAGIPLAAAVLVLGAALDISLLAQAWEGFFFWWGAGPAVAGALVALVVADLDRRSAFPVRSGGTVLLCTLLSLGGSLSLLAVPTSGANVVGAIALLGLLVAGVVMGRRLVAAAAVIALALAVPARIASTSSLGQHGEEALFIVIGLGLLVAVAKAWPTAAPVLTPSVRGELPAAAVLLGSVASPYPLVYDALLAAAAVDGPVQQANRAAGRISSAEVAFVVWQVGDATSVAAAGAPEAAGRLAAAAGLTLR